MIIKKRKTDHTWLYKKWEEWKVMEMLETVNAERTHQDTKEKDISVPSSQSQRCPTPGYAPYSAP